MKRVVLSDIAKKKLESLQDYLKDAWSDRVTRDFLNKLDRTFPTISTHLHSCAESKSHPGIFRCVVSKQTTFYYRMVGDELQIITIFDNWQNPNKLIQELNTQKNKNL